MGELLKLEMKCGPRAGGEVPLLTRGTTVTHTLRARLSRTVPLYTLRTAPHRPAPPRAGTWAARWEAVSSRPYLGGSLPDAPRRRRQSPPSRSRAKNSPPFQTTASHCRTIASVVGIPSPARPPPP